MWFFFPGVEVGPAVFTFHVLQDTELVQPGLNWHAQPAWGELPPRGHPQLPAGHCHSNCREERKAGISQTLQGEQHDKNKPLPALHSLPSHLFPSKVELCELLLLLHAGEQRERAASDHVLEVTDPNCHFCS